ncbi:MAG: hypothetical protein WDM79_02170 [Terricaulis sp.]
MAQTRYNAEASEAVRNGVRLSIGPNQGADADLAYRIVNEGGDCIAISHIDLPSGATAHLARSMALVDRSGNMREPTLVSSPTAFTTHSVLLLPRGAEVTRHVNVEGMFGVSDIEKYSATLTIPYARCDDLMDADRSAPGFISVSNIEFSKR